MALSVTTAQPIQTISGVTQAQPGTISGVTQANPGTISGTSSGPIPGALPGLFNPQANAFGGGGTVGIQAQSSNLQGSTVNPQQTASASAVQPAATDNNIASSQQANAAFLAANPNIFGQQPATPTQTTTTQPIAQTPPPPAPVSFNNLNQGFNNAVNSGTTPPQTQGAASSAIQSYSSDSSNSTAGSNATQFLNTNPTIRSAIDQVKAALQPTTTTTALQGYVDTLSAEQNVLSGLNTKMMNLQNIMNGTPDDIRSEVTAANGFATESQIMAMSTARNKTLLQQSTLLQNQINGANQAISNDQNLLDEEQKIASEQFSENSTIYNAAQSLLTQQQKASTDGLNMIINSVGLNGLVNGLMAADPTGKQLASAASLLGMSPQELQSTANQVNYANNLKVIQASGLNTPYVVTPQGEVWNSQTGQAYTSPEQFQQETGISVQQAAQNGKIGSLSSVTNLDTQKKLADIAATEANTKQSLASAAASGTSAAKSAYDLSFEKANGGQTPSEVAAASQKVIDTANTQIQAMQDKAASLIADMTSKKVDWNTAWNELHAAYPQASTNTIDNALNATQFRSKYGG